MLERVFPRSRPGPHGEPKRDVPNGLEEPITLALWGIEPALSRDSKAEVLLTFGGFASLPLSCEESGRKGLLEGVGRDDFGARPCDKFTPASPFPGGNLEGTVPARALLVAG